MWSKTTTVTCPCKQAINDFREEIMGIQVKSLFSTKFSYYQRGSKDGRPWGLRPGTTLEYWWRTRTLNPIDFEFYNTDRS